MMPGRPADQEQAASIPFLRGGSGDDRVEGTACRYDVVAVTGAVVSRNQAQVEQLQRQRGFHQHDAPAPSSSPGGQGREMRLMTARQDQVWPRQVAPGRKLPRGPLEESAAPG